METKKITQAAQILNWMQTHEGITAIEALREFGCFRLAARIFDLRKAGNRIKSMKAYTKNGSEIAFYTIKNVKDVRLGDY